MTAIDILLWLLTVSLTVNALVMRAWTKQLKENIEVLSLAVETIDEYKTLLEEVKND